jgi:hypothetical protein
MAAIKKLDRNYNMDDLDMLQLAQVFHDNFLVDESAFTAAFPSLNTPFVTNFQTAIDTADDIPSAAEVDSEIAVITEELNGKLPLGRAALQKLFTYADVAFNSVAKTNSFGKNRYEKARNSQIRMKELLELAHRQASETTNKAALIAAGYTEADIDLLESLMDDIDSLNSEQELALSERGTKTEVRVKAMNDVWEFMKKINQASKVVFVDSPAKLDLYLLYPTSSSSLPKVQGFTVELEVGPPRKALLDWNAVVGAVDYQVYMSQVGLGEPAGDYEQIVVTVDNSWEQPVVFGFRYYFKVRAVAGSELGAFSNSAYIE